MKIRRFEALLLACVLTLAAAVPVFAAGDYADSLALTVTAIEAGMAVPAVSVQAEPGEADGMEWYLQGEKSVALKPGDSFLAGREYKLYVYVNAPSGREWQPVMTGGTIIEDVPEVSVTAKNTTGEKLAAVVNSIWNGQLMVQLTMVCPGTPAPEPEPEPEKPAAPKTVFGDVPDGIWYRDWVYGAAELGLINGVGKNSAGVDEFKPDGEMTFAQAAKLAACMHQLYTEGKITLANGDPWYKSYADYCGEKGILPKTSANGTPGVDTVMSRANEAVTRKEFAWIFAHALPDGALAGKNVIPDGSVPDVKDASSPWYSSIYTLYRAGILNGSDEKGTFFPDDKISRAAVAAIVVRMMQADKRVDAPIGIVI